MSSIASTASLETAPSMWSQGSAQASFSPERRRDPFTSGFIDSKVGHVLVNYLSAETICAFTRVNQACRVFSNDNRPTLRKIQYKDRLLNQLLPGVKEEQLPLNLITYDAKTKEIEWENAYKAISPAIYGPAFFKSIGLRTVPSSAIPQGLLNKTYKVISGLLFGARTDPVSPIPQGLLEKKYHPTHTQKIPANSTLGLTRDGSLTNGPYRYAPLGHRHFRPRPAVGAEELRTLQFPNTQYNRDFLKENHDLKVDPYLMESPLEQGSPLINFQKILEINVPEGSLLRAISGGILTEEPAITLRQWTVSFSTALIRILSTALILIFIAYVLGAYVNIIADAYRFTDVYDIINVSIQLVNIVFHTIVLIHRIFQSSIYPCYKWLLNLATNCRPYLDYPELIYPRRNEPAVKGTRTVRFLNTPHNWQTLARPVLSDPLREAGPDNPYIAKYLNANAKPVSINTDWPKIKEIWDTPAQLEWQAPAAELVARGGSYLESEEEARQIGQSPMTFQQNSTHRIFSLIRGNPVPFGNQISLTAKSQISSSSPGLITPAKVSMRELINFGGIFDSGFASAWGSAENP